MKVKCDAKFDEKLTCGLENDKRNLAKLHTLENSDFMLESKMPELNQNENLKQPN